MKKHTVFKRYFIVAVLLGMMLLMQSGFAADAPVDINHASLEELTTLKYVGETIAKRIIEYREQIDGFKTIEQLLEVKGFGQKALEANKDRIVITPIKKEGG
jgi:competence protein ComEA